MRRLLVLLFVAGCGGAVASEATNGGDAPPDVADAATKRAAPSAAPGAAPREREDLVTPVPIRDTIQVSFASAPPSCEPVYDGGTSCSTGKCVVYQIPGESNGWVCVDDDPCAHVTCAVGKCGRGDDNLDNNYRCNAYALPCKNNRDCDPAHPFCVRVTTWDYDPYGSCARDYANACAYAPCLGGACIVTETDPVAIRCAP